MTTYGIRVYQPDGAPVIVPGSLDVQPQAWSNVARGGAWDADIAVFGALEELAGLTAWLGNRLEIINANGAAVWWGDVTLVEVTAGGTRRGISLDRMANRVQVRYAQPQPGGAAASADTTWAENTLSQASYGVWERRISPARAMSATEAANYRTTALATLSEPHYTLATDAAKRRRTSTAPATGSVPSACITANRRAWCSTWLAGTPRRWAWASLLALLLLWRAPTKYIALRAT
jgi:hypothetical protein